MPVRFHRVSLLALAHIESRPINGLSARSSAGVSHVVGFDEDRGNVGEVQSAQLAAPVKTVASDVLGVSRGEPQLNERIEDDAFDARRKLVD